MAKKSIMGPREKAAVKTLTPAQAAQHRAASKQVHENLKRGR